MRCESVLFVLLILSGSYDNTLKIWSITGDTEEIDEGEATKKRKFDGKEQVDHNRVCILEIHLSYYLRSEKALDGDAQRTQAIGVQCQVAQQERTSLGFLRLLLEAMGYDHQHLYTIVCMSRYLRSPGSLLGR